VARIFRNLSVIEREEDQGFTVSDRRGVAQERPTSTESSPPSSTATNAGVTPDQAHGDHGPLGPPDFSGLLLSLASSALMHLGAPTPDGSTAPVNLPRAQEMIDLLGVLEEKTKGNLTPDESALLGNMLYTLRLRYVEHAR
jgi:hypothetical protein